MAKSVSGGAGAVIAVGVLLGLATGAFAADPSGPSFGKNKITSSIQTVQGQEDTDDFVTSLVVGELLSVKVDAAKGSALRPTITLIDPDGQELVAPAVPVAIKKGGKRAQLKKFVITKTGAWAVRVGGGATQGAYTAAFSVKAAKPIKFKKQVLGGANLVNTHAFEGTDGGLLDLTLVFKPKETAPSVDSISDPSGTEVAGELGDLADEVLAKGKKKLLIQGAPLGDGDGTYSVQVAIPAGTARYNLTIRVTPQDRPVGKKAVELSSAEPFLALRGDPINGVADQQVRIAGQGFTGTPQVLFGDAPGTNVAVGGGGTFIDVTVPPGTGTTSLTVINPDKQASSRDDYFFYVPPPTITDLQTLAGVPVRGASTDGGAVLRLVGTNFLEDSTVLIGGTAATVQRVVSPTQLEILTPAAAAGTATIRLTDPFGRFTLSPFDFTFKAPPRFASEPYDPAFGPGAGGTLITLSGSGFDENDQLVLGGANAASTFVNETTRTFSSPAGPSGNVTVSLVDKFGSQVDGPDFVVKDAPTIGSVATSGGPQMGPTDLALAGGTIVTVSGADFRSDDTVTLGGQTVTATVTGSTALTFTAPAGAVGAVDVTVTDTLGQSATAVGALHYAGFVDATATRLPGGDLVDDFGAIAGALGDLDGDVDRNDLAIVSQTDYPGTRYEHTRILSNTNGTLTDDTEDEFPVYGSAYYSSYDYWQASAVAIGDLGGSYGEYVAIAGKPSLYYDGGYPYYNAYSYDIRLFSRSGNSDSTFYISGADTYTNYSPLVVYTAYAYDTYYYALYQMLAPQTPYTGFGTATSLALGDLDGDLDLDIVMGTDHYRAAQLYFDPNYYAVTDYGSFFYTYQAYFYGAGYGNYYYMPALVIFDNGIPSGYPLLDVTISRIGDAGTIPSTLPAFPMRDVELGDIDNDNDLDIVGVWDDPTTTTPYGLYSGNGYDSARLSTHVLTNDSYGVFTDDSAVWMPATSTPEFWQGHQLELADMDGDNDLDLFILLAQSTNAFQGTPTFTNHALRVLRNDRPTTNTFTDVTTTVLPSVPLSGTRDDNLRGEALLVTDLNGDGFVDILVGTSETLVDGSANTVRSTRLLGGSSSGTFTVANAFLPALSADQGEAQDFLVGDIAGANRVTVTLLSEVKGTGEHLRMYDWTR